MKKTTFSISLVMSLLILSAVFFAVMNIITDKPSTELKNNVVSMGLPGMNYWSCERECWGRYSRCYTRYCSSIQDFDARYYCEMQCLNTYDGCVTGCIYSIFPCLPTFN